MGTIAGITTFSNSIRDHGKIFPTTSTLITGSILVHALSYFAMPTENLGIMHANAAPFSDVFVVEVTNIQ